MDVYVAGVGEIPCNPIYEGIDFREMLFKAASAAYADAGFTPEDIDGVVSSGLDFFEGVSITDSYTPDQVGGRLKFNTLTSQDSLNAFIHACMLLKTGRFTNLVVSVFAKPSQIHNYSEVVLNSWDPHVVRPLLVHHHVLAGLDAHAYLSRVGGEVRDLSIVSAKNLRNGLSNPSAAYGRDVSVVDVDESDYVAEPLKKSHVANLCDYAAVVILTTNRSVGKVRVNGFGYAYGFYSCDFSSRRFGVLGWVRPAFDMAKRMSGKFAPEFAEVSEPYAHTELMVLEASEMAGGEVVQMLRNGEFGPTGSFPVNLSGGCIGMGYPLNAAGLQRIVQAVKILEKGKLRFAAVASCDAEVVDGGSVVFLSGEV